MLVFEYQKVRWYWCIFEFECVITWCMMHYDTIKIVHLPAMQLHPGKMPAMQIWNDVVVTLDAQKVRWHWCTFAFQSVIVWNTMRYDTATIAYATAIQIHYTDNGTRIVLALGEQAVRWYWFILEFTRFITWYTVHYSRSQLHTCLLFKYTTMSMMTHGSAPMLTLIEHMERCLAGFGQTDSTLVLVHVRIQMCHCSVHDAP